MMRTLNKMSNSELLEFVQMRMNEGSLSMNQIDACLYFETKLSDDVELTESELEELSNMMA